MKKSQLIQLFFLGLFMLCLLYCQGGNQPMFNSVKDLIAVMEKHTPVTILGEKNRAMLAVLPEYGGKVIAMSVDGLTGKNLLWPNPKIGSEAFWQNEKKDWNIGGARSWISPEADFYLDKKSNWFVPYEMDPGTYRLIAQQADTVICANEFHTKNINDEDFFIKITRRIELLDSYPNLNLADLKYVGMSFTHSLQNLSNRVIGKETGLIGLWSLIQLDPPGTMIIPIKKDPAQTNIVVRDYGPTNFTSVPPERITITDEWVLVKIDGKFRCKLGFAPWAARNGIAFLQYEPGSETGTLFLKEFDVEAEGIYLDHPWEKAYDYGDAIQMYNDDGRFGGFCEIECHGPAKQLAPMEKLAHTITFSIFSGKLDLLKKIAGEKLAVNMDEVKLY